MKKLLLTLFIISSLNIFSQVCVGDSSYFNESSKKNKQSDIDRIKNKKTIFVLPDFYSLSDYDKILSDTWKINSYEIITNEEYEKNRTKYNLTNNLIASYLGYSLVTERNSVATTEHIFFYIDFAIIDKINEKKKKITYDCTRIAAANFSLDYPQLRNDKIGKYGDAKPKHLYNFKLGYLKNYLQKINNDLSRNANFNCYDEFVNKEKLRELQSKKLIFTDEIVRKDVTIGSRNDRELNELLSEYKYDHEVISIDELNKRILNNEEFYYFTYTQINAKKIMTITNSKTGEVIYNYMNRMSFTIKEKDFKQVYKEIEKA